MAQKTPLEPTEIELEKTTVKVNGMTLMRVVDGSVTLDPSSVFAVVPGRRGHGWRILVYPAPQDDG